MNMDDIFKDIPIIPNNMSFAAMLDHMGSDVSMRRDRPYSGQSHTCSGERGSEFVAGLTFRDIRDCFVRGYILSHQYYEKGSSVAIQPNATLSDECRKGPASSICENDLYSLKGDVDPMAVWQNISCEIEKMMGIYPNVKGMEREGYTSS